MSVEIVTKQDLDDFRIQLIQEIKELLSVTESKPKQWLKSKEIRKLLNISPGTLQNLRINGTLPYTKIGGVILYAYADILDVLENNKYRQTTCRDSNEVV